MVDAKQMHCARREPTGWRPSGGDGRRLYCGSSADVTATLRVPQALGQVHPLIWRAFLRLHPPSQDAEFAASAAMNEEDAGPADNSPRNYGECCRWQMAIRGLNNDVGASGNI